MPDDEDARAEERLEALRRTLYRRDATGGDLQRYLAQQPEDPVPPAPSAPPPRRRRRIALVAGGVLAAGVLAVVLQATAGGTIATPGSLQPQPAAAPGQVLTPYGATVPLPTPAAVSAEGEAAAGERYRGTGDARFPVDVADAPVRRGRIVVSVTSLDGEPVGWRSVSVDPAASPAEHVFASGPSATVRGAPVVAVLPYASGPPALLEIAAPSRARWTAIVAFLPEHPPTLR